MNEIQNKIKNSEPEPLPELEPVKVGVREQSDITWTETAASNSNTNNSSNCKTRSQVQDDPTSEVRSNSNHSSSSHSQIEDTELSDQIENLKISQTNDSDSMRLLLESLQQTVDKSKKVREEYKKQKQAYDRSRTDESADTGSDTLSRFTKLRL